MPLSQGNASEAVPRETKSSHIHSFSLSLSVGEGERCVQVHLPMHVEVSFGCLYCSRLYFLSWNLSLNLAFTPCLLDWIASEHPGRVCLSSHSSSIPGVGVSHSCWARLSQGLKHFTD